MLHKVLAHEPIGNVEHRKKIVNRIDCTKTASIYKLRKIIFIGKALVMIITWNTFF
jgi:hypothetical protein